MAQPDALNARKLSDGTSGHLQICGRRLQQVRRTKMVLGTYDVMCLQTNSARTIHTRRTSLRSKTVHNRWNPSVGLVEWSSTIGIPVPDEDIKADTSAKRTRYAAKATKEATSCTACIECARSSWPTRRYACAGLDLGHTTA